MHSSLRHGVKCSEPNNDVIDKDDEVGLAKLKAIAENNCRGGIDDLFLCSIPARSEVTEIVKCAR
jgi:hypothetical protein